MLNAIIVDDEEYGRTNLCNMLRSYCRQIHISGTAASVPDARLLLRDCRPDLIFLDVQMPGEDGLALVSQASGQAGKPFVVLVTAHSRYAIPAIRKGVFDYLLKPIDPDELINCEKKMVALVKSGGVAVRPEDAGENCKISISHSKGIKLIDFNSILYLEAHNNYTIFHLVQDKAYERFVASKTLGDFEYLLDHKKFYRTHKSYIINTERIKEVLSEEHGIVIMQNDDRIEISRRKSHAFRQYLQNVYHGQMHK